MYLRVSAGRRGGVTKESRGLELVGDTGDDTVDVTINVTKDDKMDNAWHGVASQQATMKFAICFFVLIRLFTPISLYFGID